MFKKLLILFTVLVLVIPVVVLAQDDDEIAFVDIPAAEKAITEIKSTNTDLEAERKTLDDEIKTLKSQVKTDEDKLQKINDMILKIKGKGPVLYQYKSNVVDKTGKDKASDAFSDYKEILDKLNLTRETLEFAIKEKNEKIAEKEDKRATNLYKIKINNREIKGLEVAIKKSKGQVQDIDSHINTLNDFIKDAETLLGE
jgi:septal ring factor EnvC (AmiA/AmiB activator)